MDRSLSIVRRPLDLGLVIFFILSILYGFLDSLPEAIGLKAAPDSPWPPLRSLYDWAVAQEPQHLNPPSSLIATTLFDGFIQTPILFFVIYGLVKMSPWIRTLSLVYAGAAVTNMFMYFVTTFIGPNPPPHPWVYLPFNLPWLIAPAILGLRMLPAQPFARQGGGLVAA
jgi:emopamil binding protein